MRKAKNFCRIIELPQTQCLLKVEYDDADDKFYLRATFSIKGLFVTLGFGFDKESAANKMLKEMSVEQAQKLYDANFEMLSKD